MNSDSRYIALFDILGFKQIVESNALDEVVKTFAKFVISASMTRSFVTHVYEPAEISFRLFSDTILVHSRDDSKEAFLNMVRFSQALVGMMFQEGILLRGAITKGPVFISDDVFIGTPIVRAYQMEQEQEWVGCWLEDSCIDSINSEYMAKLANDIVEYHIPLKTGGVKTRLALNWTYGFTMPITGKRFDTRIEKLFQTYSGGKELSWPIRRKIEFTKSFIKHTFPLRKSARKNAMAAN